MAEFGLVSAIIEIAKFGVELSKALYKLAETMGEAETSLEHIATDVKFTSAVLKQLGSILEKCKNHDLASDSAIMTVKSVVDACSEDFDQINAAVEKAKTASEKFWLKKSFILVRWPGLQKKMERQRSDLEKHKSTLIIGLETVKWNLKLQYEAPLSYGGALAEYILQQAK